MKHKLNAVIFCFALLGSHLMLLENCNWWIDPVLVFLMQMFCLYTVGIEAGYYYNLATKNK